MKITVVASLAEVVGTHWKQLQEKATSEFFVSSPLSSTPVPIYEWIIAHANEFSSWEKMRFVLMDEMLEGEESLTYVPLSDSASYEGFANKHFLVPLSKKIGKEIEVIKPDLQRIELFQTPIDLLILALGPSGNFANVMPGTKDSVGWHIAHLTPEFRQAHTQKGSDSYEGASFREYGMSLGPKQVKSAKQIFVIISGEKKKALAKQLFSFKDFNPLFPLSIIYHPEVRDRVVVYITEDAYTK